MKKLVFILLILLLPSVLAIETTIKQEYSPAETLIAEISGNFIDNLKSENVLFYSGRVFVPLVYDLAKVQDKYYLYALLPAKERNYTLIIKNAHYIETGTEKRQDLSYNFSVKGNLSAFSVNPGFIITNNDFNIKVISTKSIDLKAEFLNSSQNITIIEGIEKRLSFSVVDVKSFTLTNLILETEGKKYEVPVAIFKSENISEENISTSDKLKFSKSSFNFTVLKDNKFEFEISLSNTGQEDIENIVLSSDADVVSITPSEISKLESGKIQKINLTIKSEALGASSCTITANSSNISVQSLVYVTTIENETSFQNIIKNNSDIINEGTCSDIKGKICLEDESCEGVIKLTLEGACCIGACNKKSSGYGNTVMIIAIVLLLAIIAFFVYKKIKAKKQSPIEILKARTSAFEERFNPTETRDSLSRV